MKKKRKVERFIARTLSPDLEYCFILDAQSGYNISDLVLLTSYWKLIKYARDAELALQKGEVSENARDRVLHHIIGEFLDCVHSYDPEKNRVSFLEFVADRLFENALKKRKKARKKVSKRVIEAINIIAQMERSLDESTGGDESRPLIESIRGNLPDQESLLHRKMLSNTFSNRIFTSLTDLERVIIEGRYYKDMTDKEVANQLGKSVTKTRTIERKALRKIRNEIRKQRLFDDLNDA